MCAFLAKPTYQPTTTYSYNCQAHKVCVCDHMQVTRSMQQHKPTVHELEVEGKWMGAPALVQVIDTARQDVEVAVLDQGLDTDVARDLHDVALACTMFGYLPPMRAMSICSLLHPNYQGECLFPSCNRPHKCHGNRLIILKRSPLKMQLHLPHHKNQTSWEQAAIQFEIPPQLASLLGLWLDDGHKLLCTHLLESGDPPCPFVFMNKEGRGYTTNLLGKWWRPWVKEHGGAEHLPPSMCRHIFVDERRSDARAEGPDKGASMAMGNSENAWDQHYDKQRHFNPRDCQEAVNAMDIWRESMLASSSSQGKYNLAIQPNTYKQTYTSSSSLCYFSESVHMWCRCQSAYSSDTFSCGHMEAVCNQGCITKKRSCGQCVNACHLSSQAIPQALLTYSAHA